MSTKGSDRPTVTDFAEGVTFLTINSKLHMVLILSGNFFACISLNGSNYVKGCTTACNFKVTLLVQ